jgi:hypothetical protein
MGFGSKSLGLVRVGIAGNAHHFNSTFREGIHNGTALLSSGTEDGYFMNDWSHNDDDDDDDDSCVFCSNSQSVETD